MQAQIISAPKSFKLCDRIDITNGYVTGLTTDSNDNLVITSRDRLLSYSENGKFINECKLGGDAWGVSFHSMSGNVVVALQENEPISDVVHCIIYDGNQTFTFNSSALEMPNGIATDRSGNVYVVGRDSNNIHRLSTNGKKSEVVLGPADGIKDPCAICFSRDYRKLFLSNEDGASVYVYECRY
ncbi:Hypothetical predicted protein [Mytilus galloprovincialis]|uniref:SMP-30/Gluconolactonase/LRE-like region domain-containing protein n=1 Tax=Mytilus galloprovincialis TaxID=29158 RepID=A0A8B6FM63_MYTGA|nr:Hypothetical predicted protein [Mytilus galloprovincialis]